MSSEIQRRQKPADVPSGNTSSMARINTSKRGQFKREKDDMLNKIDNWFFISRLVPRVLCGSCWLVVWERSAPVKKNSSGGGVGVDPCSAGGGHDPGRPGAVTQPSSVPRVPQSATDHIQISWTARLCCTFFDFKPTQTSEVSFADLAFFVLFLFLSLIHSIS